MIKKPFDWNCITFGFLLTCCRSEYTERCVMNNYFGIGLDAKITLDFQNKRDEHPEKCRYKKREKNCPQTRKFIIRFCSSILFFTNFQESN